MDNELAVGRKVVLSVYRRLPFMRGWPVHVLTDNVRMATFNYYRSMVTANRMSIKRVDLIITPPPTVVVGVVVVS